LIKGLEKVASLLIKNFVFCLCQDLLEVIFRGDRRDSHHKEATALLLNSIGSLNLANALSFWGR